MTPSASQQNESSKRKRPDDQKDARTAARPPKQRPVDALPGTTEPISLSQMAKLNPNYGDDIIGKSKKVPDAFDTETEESQWLIENPAAIDKKHKAEAPTTENKELDTEPKENKKPAVDEPRATYNQQHAAVVATATPLARQTKQPKPAATYNQHHAAVAATATPPAVPTKKPRPAAKQAGMKFVNKPSRAQLAAMAEAELSEVVPGQSRMPFERPASKQETVGTAAQAKEEQTAPPATETTPAKPKQTQARKPAAPKAPTGLVDKPTRARKARAAALHAATPIDTSDPRYAEYAYLAPRVESSEAMNIIRPGFNKMFGILLTTKALTTRWRTLKKEFSGRPLSDPSGAQEPVSTRVESTSSSVPMPEAVKKAPRQVEKKEVPEVQQAAAIESRSNETKTVPAANNVPAIRGWPTGTTSGGNTLPAPQANLEQTATVPTAPVPSAPVTSEPQDTGYVSEPDSLFDDDEEEGVTDIQEVSAKTSTIPVPSAPAVVPQTATVSKVAEVPVAPISTKAHVVHEPEPQESDDASVPDLEPDCPVNWSLPRLSSIDALERRLFVARRSWAARATTNQEMAAKWAEWTGKSISTEGIRKKCMKIVDKVEALVPGLKSARTAAAAEKKKANPKKRARDDTEDAAGEVQASPPKRTKMLTLYEGPEERASPEKRPQEIAKAPLTKEEEWKIINAAIGSPNLPLTTTRLLKKRIAHLKRQHALFEQVITGEIIDLEFNLAARDADDEDGESGTDSDDSEESRSKEAPAVEESKEKSEEPPVITRQSSPESEEE